jgi:hypothetical protein
LKSTIAVAIPASLTAEVPHLREKTVKVGLIGRTLAIFRIDRVIIYPDLPEMKREGELMADLLRYMETPQYLRKRLIPLKPHLRYAGILPPLGTPHHPLEDKGTKVKAGSFREGVIINSDNKRSLVDIGVENPVQLNVPRLPAGERITVKIVKSGKVPSIELARREEVNAFWGYEVITSDKPLGKFVREYKADLVIATSRYGQPVQEVLREIAVRWRGKILFLFGSPSEGLREILARENLRPEDISDFVVNTIPEQGVRTVRTEEALISTLAVFNVLAHSHSL